MSSPALPSRSRCSRGQRIAGALALFWQVARPGPAAALPELTPAAGLVAPDGLSGGRYVPSARPTERRAHLSTGLGYGYTEGVLGAHDHHHRYELELGLGGVVAPWLQLAALWTGRRDVHRGDTADAGYAGSLALRTRHRLAELGPLQVALSGELTFPAGLDVSRSVRGISPGAGLALSYLASRRDELHLSIGFRADRSARAIGDPERLSASDRLASGAMQAHVVPLGLALSHAEGPLRGVLEWSWDVLTGAPYPATDGPMRLRVAAQARWGARCAPGLELVLRPERPPELEALLRVEPRFWARVTLAVALDPEPPRAAQPSAARESGWRVIASELKGTVRTEGAEAVLASIDVLELNETVHTDSAGQFQLKVRPGTYTLRVSAPGYESEVRRALVERDGVTILVVELGRSR